jgi:hypothetical protein
MAKPEMAKNGIGKCDFFCHLKLEQFWDLNTFQARELPDSIQMEKKYFLMENICHFMFWHNRRNIFMVSC